MLGLSGRQILMTGLNNVIFSKIIHLFHNLQELLEYSRDNLVSILRILRMEPRLTVYGPLDIPEHSGGPGGVQASAYLSMLWTAKTFEMFETVRSISQTF